MIGTTRRLKRLFGTQSGKATSSRRNRTLSHFPDMIRLERKNILFPEQLGTKEKSWVIHDGKQYLFKVGRKRTGENWAEVVACGLCRLLELPCAEYQFAELEGDVGVLTETIVPENGRLVFGNELLAKYVEQYEREKKYKQRQYTLRSVIALFKNLEKSTTTPYGWKPLTLFRPRLTSSPAICCSTPSSATRTDTMKTGGWSSPATRNNMWHTALIMPPAWEETKQTLCGRRG